MTVPNLYNLEEIHQYWREEFETRILPSYLDSLKSSKCFYCKRTIYDLSWHKQMTGEDAPYDQESTIDHVIPKSKGGTEDPSNKVKACRRCNTKKGVKIWQ